MKYIYILLCLLTITGCLNGTIENVSVKNTSKDSINFTLSDSVFFIKDSVLNKIHGEYCTYRMLNFFNTTNHSVFVEHVDTNIKFRNLSNLHGIDRHVYYRNEGWGTAMCGMSYQRHKIEVKPNSNTSFFVVDPFYDFQKLDRLGPKDSLIYEIEYCVDTAKNSDDHVLQKGYFLKTQLIERDFTLK